MLTTLIVTLVCVYVDFKGIFVVPIKMHIALNYLFFCTILCLTIGRMEEVRYKSAGVGAISLPRI